MLLSTDQLSTVRKLISSGVAAGFLFRDLMKTNGDMAGLSLDPPMGSTISLVWRSGVHHFRDMARLIDYVQGWAASAP